MSSKRSASRALKKPGAKVVRSNVPDVKNQGVTEAAGTGAPSKVLQISSRPGGKAGAASKDGNDKSKDEYDFQNIDPERIIIQVRPDELGRLMQDLIPADNRGRPKTSGKDNKPVPCIVKLPPVVVGFACTAANGNYGSQYCPLDKKHECVYTLVMLFGKRASDLFHKYIMSEEVFFEKQKDALAWLAKHQRAIHNEQWKKATSPDSVCSNLCDSRILASRKKAVNSIATKMGYSEEDIEKHKPEEMEDIFFQEGKHEEYLELWKRYDERMFTGKMKKLPIPYDFDIRLAEERKAKEEGRPYTPVFGEDPILVRATMRIYSPKKGGDKGKSNSSNGTDDNHGAMVVAGVGAQGHAQSIFRIDDFTAPENFVRRQFTIYGNEKDPKTGRWLRIEQVNETDERIPALSVIRAQILTRASQNGLSIKALSAHLLEVGAGYDGHNPFEDEDEYVNEDNMAAYHREMEKQKLEAEEAQKAKAMAATIEAAMSESASTATGGGDDDGDEYAVDYDE